MANVKKPKNKTNLSVIFLAIAAVALLVGGMWYFSQTPFIVQPLPNETKTNAINTPMAKLLLSSFDRGAALENYAIEYAVDDNGAKTQYHLYKNNTQKYIKIMDNFGSVEGFFGENPDVDVLCLTYEYKTTCAELKNHTDMNNIAASLEIYFPNKKTYEDQRKGLASLLSAGAIEFDGVIVNEKVGDFNAEKISYTLDYRGLTVNQLLVLGLNPNNPEITGLTDQKVTYWVDKESGMLVKSYSSYRDGLLKKYFQIEYSEFVPARATIPNLPSAIISTPTFVNLYRDSQKSYTELADCLVRQSQEKDMCLKALATARGSWDVCKLINDAHSYEICSVIVAQETHSMEICSALDVYSDDCWIVIVSETGDFELCKRLKDQTLGEVCAQAAIEGQVKADAAAAAEERYLANMNCNIDSDCKLAGSANQFCVQKDQVLSAGNESSPLLVCYVGVPCGCIEGYCGFAKNETYYACVSAIEKIELENFIKQFAWDNQTSNSTNISGMNNTG